MFFADRFGLVALIASGYRTLSYVLIVVYVLPLLTYGVWRLWQRRSEQVALSRSDPVSASVAG